MYGRRSRFKYKRRRASKTAFFNSLLKTRRYARKRTKQPLIGKRRGLFRKTGFYGRFRGEGAENKFHDVNLIIQPVIGGSILDSIIKIPQGTGESERIGRKINIVSLQLNYTLHLAVDPIGSTSQSVRVIIYVDQQTNGVGTGQFDLLNTNEINSHYNLANQDRYAILWDKTWDMNRKASAAVGAGSASVIKQGQYNIPLDIPVEYSGTTGGITEFRTNNISIMTFRRFNAGSVAMDAFFRLRYSDA